MFFKHFPIFDCKASKRIVIKCVLQFQKIYLRKRFCKYISISKLRTWCFQYSCDISCSLLVNPSHTDKSWAGRSTSMWICTIWIYSLSTLQNTDENKIYFIRSPQAFWLSSAPGVLSTLVTSVVIYSLTQATLMSPGQD